MSDKGPNSFNSLRASQIILRSKNGPVKIAVNELGNLIFSSANNSSNATFSFDLKNDKISVNKLEFKNDNSSLSSVSNIGSSSTSLADSKFDSNGKLLDSSLSDTVKADIAKGVSVNGKFDGNTGKLLDLHLTDSIKADIAKGVSVNSKFDGNTGKLLDLHLSDSIKSDVAKGVAIDGKFDTNTGKLLDLHLSDSIKSDVAKGVSVNNKFDTNSGKLLDLHLSDSIKSDVARGVGAHDDLNTADIELDNLGKIRFNRGGSRGTTTGATITKSHVGLALAENKSSETIRNEITIVNGMLSGIGTPNIKVDNESAFGDTRFTNVQTNAINGASAHADLNNISISVTNGLVTLNKGGSRGSSTSTLTSTHVGLGNVDNKSSSTIIGETLVHPTFTAVSGSAVSGLLAHNDLNTADISIDSNGLIKFNRGGSRGTSTGATITKSHVGLSLAENKSSSTIVGEAFTDARFTNVSASARDGLSSGSAARNFFDNSGTPQLKDVNTPSGLKNSNISLSLVGNSLSLVGAGGVSATFTNSTVGLGNVENKNVSTIKTETFSDSRFTTVSGNTNTIYNRFDDGGRLLEANSLNNLVKYLSAGDIPNSSPQEFDQVFLAGTNGAIGYSLTYGTKNYNFSVFPGASKKVSIDTISLPTANNFLNIETIDYLKSEFSVSDPTSLGLVYYLYQTNSTIIGTTYSKDYAIISNNSNVQHLTFNNLFYGPIYIEISYNPVQFIANGSYWNSVGYNGNNSSVPQFFIEKRSDESNTWTASSVVWLDKNNNDVSVGSVISSTDGVKASNKKLIYKTENLSGFNQIRLTFDSTVNNSAFAIDNIKITSWFRNVDADSLSKLYQLATNANFSFTFTGQHKSHFVGNENEISEGLIVSSFGQYDNVSYEGQKDILRYKPNIDESVPKVSLSIIKNDKKVFGVISKKSNNSKYLNPIFPENGLKTNFSDSRYEINSLGEGGIWVCNINGNLENGDYITTCEIPGYGMKQDDDLLHNYTVAKITCDCDFNLESSIYSCEEFEYQGKTYRKAFVGCTYHCG